MAENWNEKFFIIHSLKEIFYCYWLLIFSKQTFGYDWLNLIWLSWRSFSLAIITASVGASASYYNFFYKTLMMNACLFWIRGSIDALIISSIMSSFAYDILYPIKKSKYQA